MQFRSPPHVGFKSPIEDAVGWARCLARRHHTILSTGIDMGKDSHHGTADRIIGGESPREATRRTKTYRPDRE